VRLSVSPWGRLRTRTFQRHGCLSMTAADTRGCSCRRTRGLSPKTLFESRHGRRWRLFRVNPPI
jgi:hypothetical protein